MTLHRYGHGGTRRTGGIIRVLKFTEGGGYLWSEALGGFRLLIGGNDTYCLYKETKGHMVPVTGTPYRTLSSAKKAAARYAAGLPVEARSPRSQR